MNRVLAVSLVAAAALGAAACGSTKKGPPPSPGTDLAMQIKGYQVVWTRGGKLGYMRTYDVSRRGESPVEIHYLEDLDFRQVGWVANDGQAERWVYPPTKVAEAKRITFDRVTLPVDTLENSVKRIFEVDPLTEIALRPAADADFRK
jgi:hypothetical protein